MKPTLLMHIGHGKTGSSFLQSNLSTNRQFLLKNGISYPVEKTDKSSQGHISSGNGILLTRHLRDGTLTEFTDTVSEKAVLFSSEFFYHSAEWINNPELTENSKFEKAKVLLFIRDPASLISSMYQQTVKRGGYHGSIDDYTAGYSFYRKLSSVINQLTNNDFYDLKLYNYSRHKKSLNQVLSNWLGVSDFPKMPFKTVNRSLTLSELLLQRELNRFFGKESKVVADAFCTHLPNLTAATIEPSEAALNEFLDREGKYIESVNNMIDPKEHLEVSKPAANVEDPELTFSSDQMRVFCKTLGLKFRLK